MLLRPAFAKSGRTFDEITAAIRARVGHDGPPVSIEEMDRSVAEMWARGGPDWDE